jgi:hypothetical protein
MNEVEVVMAAIMVGLADDAPTEDIAREVIRALDEYRWKKVDERLAEVSDEG